MTPKLSALPSHPSAHFLPPPPPLCHTSKNLTSRHQLHIRVSCLLTHVTTPKQASAVCHVSLSSNHPTTDLIRTSLLSQHGRGFSHFLKEAEVCTELCYSKGLTTHGLLSSTHIRHDSPFWPGHPWVQWSNRRVAEPQSSCSSVCLTHTCRPSQRHASTLLHQQWDGEKSKQTEKLIQTLLWVYFVHTNCHTGAVKISPIQSSVV